MHNEPPTPITFEEAMKTGFDETPMESRIKVYGVRYVFVVDDDDNEFYVTRLGWRLLENLQSENWYKDKAYAKRGERLVEGSGVVYRVPTTNSRGIDQNLVVKFSRFAEEVPLQVAKTFPDKMPAEVVQGAMFNDPFQEFGLLVDLRNGHFGRKTLKIMTKHPICIFSPARKCAPWRLGRERGRFDRYRSGMAANNDSKYSKMDLDFERQYVYLFAWVKGTNADVCAQQGLITAQEAGEITMRAADEMRDKGFRVLDNKPSHVILRQRSNGELLRRNGELVYALVDFELLLRTEEYKEFLRNRDKANA
ncbi:hypothetical protein [Novipirellula artificiosorum]|uniref:Uncharacterized protein n=1 Tax=Novipirellula artificiosorum TaxID=2528016 RepID=A0A5C6DMN7_9BACT|nr:hypothetical protein [Novipirellula artificiosorum]TWU36196.1 hypothetical protein Poly41_39500 [Novipirellula artificiosorum]